MMINHNPHPKSGNQNSKYTFRNTLHKSKAYFYQTQKKGVLDNLSPTQNNLDYLVRKLLIG